MIEIVYSGLFAIALAIVGYVIGINKTNAEVRNLDANTEIMDVELSDRVIEFYKKQTEGILKIVAEMQNTIETMQSEIIMLKDNQCIMENCPVRIKILDKKRQ